MPEDTKQQEEKENPLDKLEQDSPEGEVSVDIQTTLLELLITIFLDIFRVIGICVLGIQDKTKDFMNDLEMAERYLRWGEDQKDIEDFITALNYCKHAKDEDVSKGNIIVRKYKIVFSCLNSIMWITFNEFQSKFYEKVNEYKSMLYDINSCRKDFYSNVNAIKELYREESIFNAQEKEIEAEKMRTKLNRMIYKRQAFVETNAFEGTYKSAIQGIDDLQEKLNQMIVVFKDNTRVNNETKNAVLQGIGEKSESIKQQLANYSPFHLRQEYKNEEVYGDDTFEIVAPIIEVKENGDTISLIAKEIEAERKAALEEEANNQ